MVPWPVQSIHYAISIHNNPEPTNIQSRITTFRNPTISTIVHKIRKKNPSDFIHVDVVDIKVYREKDGATLPWDSIVHWDTSDTPLFLSGKMMYFVLLHDIYYSSAMK
jgi:hypothetical protein